MIFFSKLETSNLGQILQTSPFLELGQAWVSEVGLRNRLTGMKDNQQLELEFKPELKLRFKLESHYYSGWRVGGGWVGLTQE